MGPVRIRQRHSIQLAPSLLAVPLLVMATLLTSAPAFAQRGELPVPRLKQVGDIANCGPTAAAMMLAAYSGETQRKPLERLRDRLGQWSWDKFPVRRLSLPGYDAGASTPAMLKETLNHFARGVAFDAADPSHPWIPQDAWSLVTLRANLEAGRPVLALVTSKDIWDMPAAGLHWIVVRAIDGDRVVFNDPADRSRSVVPLSRFSRAWKLNGIFAAIFPRYTSLTADVAMGRTGTHPPKRTALR